MNKLNFFKLEEPSCRKTNNHCFKPISNYDFEENIIVIDKKCIWCGKKEINYTDKH